MINNLNKMICKISNKDRNIRQTSKNKEDKLKKCMISVKKQLNLIALLKIKRCIISVKKQLNLIAIVNKNK